MGVVAREANNNVYYGSMQYTSAVARAMHGFGAEVCVEEV